MRMEREGSCRHYWAVARFRNVEAKVHLLLSWHRGTQGANRWRIDWMLSRPIFGSHATSLLERVGKLEIDTDNYIHST